MSPYYQMIRYGYSNRVLALLAFTVLIQFQCFYPKVLAYQHILLLRVLVLLWHHETSSTAAEIESNLDVHDKEQSVPSEEHNHSFKRKRTSVETVTDRDGHRQYVSFHISLLGMYFFPNFSLSGLQF